MKKNVIYILCDQLRASSLSCYGETNINTPNLDLLATEGILFENAVASTPLCTPARGNMMTGRRVYEHTASGHDYHLNHDIPFISDVFNDNHFKTMYFGKWHLDGSHIHIVNEASRLIVPRQERGDFDVWLGYENNNNQNHFYLHGHDQNGEIESHLINQYETDYITDLAIKHIEDSIDEDFFVWMNFQPPHDPYIAPAQYHDLVKVHELVLRDNVPRGGKYEGQARKDLAGYYAMIKNIDDNIGKLINKLRELGIYKDTNIVFTSDHGDMHGSHGQYRKTTYFEESIKVPFIIGGTVPLNEEGHRCGRETAIIDQYDIAPTLIGLAGLEVPTSMEGVDYSYKRYARTTGDTKDITIFGNYIPTGHGDSFNQQFRGLLTTDGIKYIVSESGELALFNLTEDKYEQVNLLFNPLYSELVAKTRLQFIDEIERTNDPFKNLDVFKVIKNKIC